MLVGGVVRDEVEPDVDVVLASLGDERVVVGERPVVGVDVEVVGDVVAPVDVRARVDRREPQRIDAERREVREMRPNAAERAKVDLIDGQLIVQVSPEDTSACKSPSPLAFASCAWTSSSYDSRSTSRNTPSGIAASFSQVSWASANAVAKSDSSCVIPV